MSKKKNNKKNNNFNNNMNQNNVKNNNYKSNNNKNYKNNNVNYNNSKNTNSKNKNVNYNKINSNYKNNQDKLQNTTKIRIDKSRLNDIETLDTSFIDSGVKKVKIDDTNIKKKEKKSKTFPKFIIFVLVCIIFCLSFFVFLKVYNTKIIENEVEKVVIDNNYLFLGDSITEYYDINNYYSGMPVVNSGKSGNTTKDILKDIDNRVYVYNPSKVFILIGTNDLIYDISMDDTINNVNKIINKIKKNRPFCEIYLESIYPINNSDDDKINHKMVTDKRTNKIIKKMNKRLKEVAENEKIVYIDVYSKLVDKDGNLDIDYTIDGLHLSKEGYKVVTNKLLKYVKE